MARRILTALDAGNGVTMWQLANRDYSKPLVNNDKLFVIGSDGQGPAVLLALAARSGQEIWTCRLPEADSVQTLATVAGGLVFFTGKDTINAVDVETGQLRWRARLGGLIWVKPVTSDDSLCFTHGGSTTIYALPLLRIEPAIPE